jgi:hypothetical protein
MARLCSICRLERKPVADAAAYALACAPCLEIIDAGQLLSLRPSLKVRKVSQLTRPELNWPSSTMFTWMRLA